MSSVAREALPDLSLRLKRLIRQLWTALSIVWTALEYQEKMKKGKTPYRGHFFNHFLPIKDRPKSDYGKLEFRRYLNNSVE